MNANELRAKLLKSLDNIIENGRWEGSLFLKNILKRLELLRSNLRENMGAEEEIKLTALADFLVQKEGYELVYIEIYQSDCENLESWLSTIKNLASHYVSRPVYRNEEYAQELVRSKNSRTDAYVAVWVKSSDIIIQPDLQDRFGHELVRLGEGGVILDNISHFVHGKTVYNYIDNKLMIRGDHASP